MSVCLPANLSIYLSIYLSTSVCLSVYIPTYLSTYLSTSDHKTFLFLMTLNYIIEAFDCLKCTCIKLFFLNREERWERSKKRYTCGDIFVVCLVFNASCYSYKLCLQVFEPCPENPTVAVDDQISHTPAFSVRETR